MQLWSQHLGGAEDVQLLKPDLCQDLSKTGKMLVFVTHSNTFFENMYALP